LFTLRSFSKIIELAQIFGLLFPTYQVKYLFTRQKMGLATFWATFSQTHLVTLLRVKLTTKKLLDD
jgi:glucose uptake protein GlcU